MASSSPLTIDPKNPEKLESLGNFVSSSCGKITPNFYQLAAQRKLLSSYSTKKNPRRTAPCHFATLANNCTRLKMALSLLFELQTCQNKLALMRKLKSKIVSFLCQSNWYILCEYVPNMTCTTL